MTWLYARRRRLLDPDLPPTVVRQFTARAFVTSAIFLLSIGAAFLGLPAAVVFWLVLIPAGRILVRALTQRGATSGDAHASSQPP